MSVVKALKTLAAIPPPKRNLEVNATIKWGAEYLLKHHIFKQSHDLHALTKPEWVQLGFPADVEHRSAGIPRHPDVIRIL